MEIKDWECTAYAIAFPTKYFTLNNKRKGIRALGEIGVYLPMLPWTVAAVLLILITFLVLSGIVSVMDWWDNV